MITFLLSLWINFLLLIWNVMQLIWFINRNLIFYLTEKTIRFRLQIINIIFFNVTIGAVIINWISRFKVLISLGVLSTWQLSIISCLLSKSCFPCWLRVWLIYFNRIGIYRRIYSMFSKFEIQILNYIMEASLLCFIKRILWVNLEDLL